MFPHKPLCCYADGLLKQHSLTDAVHLCRQNGEFDFMG